MLGVFFRLIEIKDKIIAVRFLVLAPACSPAVASSHAKLNCTAIRHTQINLRGWRWDAAPVVIKIRLCAITFGSGLLNEMNILCTVIPERSTHWREQLKAFIVLNGGCRLNQKEIELFWWEKFFFRYWFNINDIEGLKQDSSICPSCQYQDCIVY